MVREIEDIARRLRSIGLPDEGVKRLRNVGVYLKEAYNIPDKLEEELKEYHHPLGMSYYRERSLVVVEGEDRILRATEEVLLRVFVDNLNKVMSEREIIEKIDSPDAAFSGSFLKMRIWRLRKQVEPDPKNPKMIKSVYGRGYMFEDLSKLSAENHQNP